MSNPRPVPHLVQVPEFVPRQVNAFVPQGSQVHLARHVPLVFSARTAKVVPMAVRLVLVMTVSRAPGDVWFRLSRTDRRRAIV